MRKICRRILVLAVATTFTLSTSADKPTSLAERLGYPDGSRLLIIHADDFGMTHSVNRATEEALERHWVTSASVMTTCPWFPEVAHWAQAHRDADLGLHLTLNSDWTEYRWVPVSLQSKNSSLLDAEGYLPLTTQNVALAARTDDVQIEARAQIERALGLGLQLSHIDPHMGTMTSTGGMSNIYVNLAQDYHLPVLLQRKDIGVWNDLQVGVRTKDYGGELNPKLMVLDAVLQIMPGVPKAKWIDAYKKMLAQLPPGVYELVVHLGYDDPEMQGATLNHPHWGAEWRQNDFDLVKSAEFRNFIKDQRFVLISWKELSSH